MSLAAPTAGVPILHHLNNSQSQRILWLLEELGIEYELKLYKRTNKRRAPPELKSVHELGKSPVLVTAEGRTIIESTVITTYLLKTYDTVGKFAAKDWIRDDQLTTFAGASLGPIMVVALLFDLLAKHTPWPLVYISRAINNGATKNFVGPEFKAQLTMLEKYLGDEDFFNGKEPGRSDVALQYPLDVMIQRKWVNMEVEYPKIAAWQKRVQERPAWKRGIEKGNGYDLTSW